MVLGWVFPGHSCCLRISFQGYFQYFSIDPGWFFWDIPSVFSQDIPNVSGHVFRDIPGVFPGHSRCFPADPGAGPAAGEAGEGGGGRSLPLGHRLLRGFHDPHGKNQPDPAGESQNIPGIDPEKILVIAQSRKIPRN